MERITATYFIETPFDVEKAAKVLAGEQSSGTFVAIPGETEALKQRFAAKVEAIKVVETVAQPALPGAEGYDCYHRAEIKVSWSIENFGHNLPVMISTLQGNLYELTQFTGLKLMDIDIPDSFAKAFNGPKFGIEGCRKLTGVYNRPLIGTIIKPSIGLSVQDTAALVKTLAEAGIDFVKDDELLSSSANSPFEKRVDAVMEVINRQADVSGKKVMYAFNLSGETDDMLRRYDYLVKAGGTCAMVSINSVGLAGAKKICDQGELPVHGHRNGWGMMTRHPLLGIDFIAYQKLWRLVGVDQLHVNGIQNKFWESDDSVVRSIEACRRPLLGGYEVLPVVSSGQWGGQAPETYRRTQTVDLLYMAGGGIMAHPDGPAGGVVALKQAWEAAVKGWSIEEAAQFYPEFAKSVAKIREVIGFNYYVTYLPMWLQNNPLLLAFYGDDFTGSTDALEFMSRAGARTVLFIEPPTLEQIAQYEGVQAIGVAGLSRSLSPEEMERQLRPAFEALLKLQPRHIHYKVCSTFDSSPAIGSIGKAMEIGAEVFDSEWIPLLVAAPALGRYCAFGNLFARMGIGSQGQIHRLDRHPSMRVHPVTPATESDLRLHLAQQSHRKTGLLDILQIRQADAKQTLQRLVKEGFENVLIDALYEDQMPKIGELIDESRTGDKSLFSVGSSGIEMALGKHWQNQGFLTERKSWEEVQNDLPILVISGSCSPVSAQQIAWAETHGFASIDVDTAAVAAQSNDVSVLQKTMDEAIEKLALGQSVIVQTSSHNTDPRIDRANRIFESQGYTQAQIRTLTGQVFGKALGTIAKEITKKIELNRIIVAGGDTSSYAARAMGIEAVEMLAPLTPGAPICLAHAPNSPVDKKQIIFKGGQVGAENYYGLVAGNP